MCVLPALLGVLAKLLAGVGECPVFVRFLWVQAVSRPAHLGLRVFRAAGFAGGVRIVRRAREYIDLGNFRHFICLRFI